MNPSALIKRLPDIRGRYTPYADLQKQVWFRVGGPAEVLFKPKDAEDLCHFLKNKPADVPLTILGVGSNILVRDGGIPGVVIRLGRGFSEISIQGNTLIAGAGALDRTIALTAADAGLGGLSFLAGIPGTLGGAVKMNAGAYGHEIKDRFISCKVATPEGDLKTLEAKDLGFSYRHSTLPEGYMVVEATFEGEPNQNPEDLHQAIHKIMEERELSQPTRSRTGGSTFKNPQGKKAWELIDAAGCRGHKIGGAIVSEKHCNFIINEGTATAEDLEELGTHVQKQVLLQSGVPLEWEIKKLGIKKGLNHA